MNQSETEIEILAEEDRAVGPSAIRGNRARSSAARRAGDPAARGRLAARHHAA